MPNLFIAAAGIALIAMGAGALGGWVAAALVQHRADGRGARRYGKPESRRTPKRRKAPYSADLRPASPSGIHEYDRFFDNLMRYDGRPQKSEEKE